MEYHFERQEITGDRVLFALSLDKKSGKERILIGTETEIIKRLWGYPDAKIYYDEVHPIGTLFINKRQDGTDWTDRGFMPLWHALHTTRWKQPELERSAASYCSEMYRSGDPFAIYTAIRLSGTDICVPVNQGTEIKPPNCLKSTSWGSYLLWKNTHRMNCLTAQSQM